MHLAGASLPVPGAQEDSGKQAVAQHGRDCSVTEAEQRSSGQEPVYQSKTKACFVITGRGWNTSELTSPPKRLHNTRLPFQQSHHPPFPHSSRSLSSTQKYLTYYSPQRLPWLSTLHPIGMPCISGDVTLVALSFVPCLPLFWLLKLCAMKTRGAESGLFYSVRSNTVCHLHISYSL